MPSESEPCKGGINAVVILMANPLRVIAGDSRLTQHPQRAPREISENIKPVDNLAARTSINVGQVNVYKCNLPYNAGLILNIEASKPSRSNPVGTVFALANVRPRPTEDHARGMSPIPSPNGAAYESEGRNPW